MLSPKVGLICGAEIVSTVLCAILLKLRGTTSLTQLRGIGWSMWRLLDTKCRVFGFLANLVNNRGGDVFVAYIGGKFPQKD